jgi:ferredoxin
MAFIIVDTCTKDEKCIEVCPVDCIHPRKDEAQFADATQLFVDPVNCIDCGACVPVCEAAAIFPEAELPENYAAFVEKNAQYYQ